MQIRVVNSRAFILFFVFACSVHAVGLDSFEYYGLTKGNQLINLIYQSDPGFTKVWYSSKANAKYTYCLVSASSIACASDMHGPAKLIYVRAKGNALISNRHRATVVGNTVAKLYSTMLSYDEDNFYVCNLGCGPDVADLLITISEAGD